MNMLENKHSEKKTKAKETQGATKIFVTFSIKGV